MNENQKSEEKEEARCAFSIKFVLGNAVDDEAGEGFNLSDTEIHTARVVTNTPWIEAEFITDIEENVLAAFGNKFNFVRVVGAEIIIPEDFKPDESDEPSSGVELVEADPDADMDEEWTKIIDGDADCKFPTEGVFLVYGESVEQPGAQKFMSYTNRPGFPLKGLQAAFESAAKNNGCALEDIYLVSLHPMGGENDEEDEDEDEGDEDE